MAPMGLTTTPPEGWWTGVIPENNPSSAALGDAGAAGDPVARGEAVQQALQLVSQALHHADEPSKAIEAAYKLLKPHGQILILDLLKHNFEKARELYGDRWLGFAESDLQRWLEGAGFKKIEIDVVAREEQPPHFETVLAAAQK